MNYADQQAWRDIQAHLPEKLHFTSDYAPTEEWWPCQGHRVHLDRFRNPDAPVRVIQFHGVGTNGRQMSMICGGPLWKLGYETVAIDMPTYGLTEPAKGKVISYDDWVSVADEFINFELAQDPRPIVLYGLSAGGMLAYHAAAVNGNVKGIVGMCFLDQREQFVRDGTARNLFMSRVGVPLAHISAATPLARLKLPMSLVAKMSTLVNDRAALRTCMRDKTSAGNWVTTKFLSSYMGAKPAVDLEDFDVCPIMLTQPAEDRWTPHAQSAPFIQRLTKVKTQTVMLENAGHYPLEQPGLDQMIEAIDSFIKSLDL